MNINMAVSSAAHIERIELDVRMVLQLVHLVVLFNLLRSSTMDGVLPALVELCIISTHTVVQNWSLLDCLECLSRPFPVFKILRRTAHCNHIHNVLCVGILCLSQVQCFEFLPHWRVVTLCIDLAV